MIKEVSGSKINLFTQNEEQLEADDMQFWLSMIVSMAAEVTTGFLTKKIQENSQDNGP